MGRMIFDLTDDDRIALERVRVRQGARSHAEALRLLIRHADESPPALVSITGKRSALEAPLSNGAVPLYDPKRFNPQPKKGTKK